LNRRAKGRLIAAEKLAAAASMSGDFPELKPELDRAWDHLLTNHFHDVICGTCAPDATEEAIYRYGGVLETAGRVLHQATRPLSARFDRRPPAPFRESLAVCLTNPLSWARSGPLSFYGFLVGRGMAAPNLVDGDGKPIDSQRVEPDFGDPAWPKALLCTAKVPAGGAAMVHLVDDPSRAPV